MILNLTQHAASAEQLAAGVVDLPEAARVMLAEFMTFERHDLFDADWPDLVLSARNTDTMIVSRARQIAQIADDHDAEFAMIGGAMWLMAPLERELRERGIIPLFAFSERESREETLPDGSVRKTTVFVHRGFVEAVVSAARRVRTPMGRAGRCK